MSISNDGYRSTFGLFASVCAAGIWLLGSSCGWMGGDGSDGSNPDVGSSNRDGGADVSNRDSGRDGSNGDSGGDAETTEAESIETPIEVIGSKGYTETVEFDVDDPTEDMQTVKDMQTVRHAAFDRTNQMTSNPSVLATPDRIRAVVRPGPSSMDFWNNQRHADRPTPCISAAADARNRTAGARFPGRARMEAGQ